MKIDRIERPNLEWDAFDAVAEWYIQEAEQPGDAIRISDVPTEFTGATTKRILAAIMGAIFRKIYDARVPSSDDQPLVSVERADDSRTPHSWIITKL